MSFAYWNPRLLEAPRLLNAQTGEYLPVRAEALGADRILVGGRAVDAQRYRLTARDFAITLWYSPRGAGWRSIRPPTAAACCATA
jgi:hypothetical protein